jgi:hypothetical protein
MDLTRLYLSDSSLACPSGRFQQQMRFNRLVFAEMKTLNDGLKTALFILGGPEE